MLTAAIFSALILFMLIPIGISADYNADGLKLCLRVSFTRIHIYPKLKRKQKIRKIKLNFSNEERISMVKITLKALKRLKNSVIIDKIKLFYLSSSPDPGLTALNYGLVNAAIGTFLPWLESRFKVKDKAIDVSADYCAGESKCDFAAAISVRLYRFLYTAILFSAEFLSVLMQSLIRKNKERRTLHG